ncbi:pentatricopeptide repeat-containing protein At2g20710, mitochondrial-like isoform X1 [Pyrus x bretschneideri]|uniref:pentatricopeptide repeat-containing protein At2g20710, mitochondrial-like isoform X1 n=2 Tax=Pyrus x bretschneideri TaxID=225117 RepID=UPI00202DCE36|nr:pentatricopeptide repeat-containing protein At2g20710, mitochondrial-like isoform X1 [Pyrus x bretschneideri]
MKGEMSRNGSSRGSVKLFRKHRRYSHALQISEWMSDAQNQYLTPGDIAVRLDLISKVYSLQQAEAYFNSIPDQLRNFKVYGALLFSYVENKSSEKAETIFEKMNELGYLKGSLVYNAMLTLYSQIGKHEKLDILVKEMEEKGIDYDSYTLKIQLNSYAAISEIDKLEKVLMKIEADPLVNVDWDGYVIAANGFLKAGLLEKASTMLRRSEQLIGNQTNQLHMKSSSLYTLLLGIKMRFIVFGIYTKIRWDYTILAIFVY